MDMIDAIQRLKRDLLRLQGAFAKDALESGRHSPPSLANLIEETGRLADGYEGSDTEYFAASIRACSNEVRLEVIPGGKSDDAPVP